MRQKQTVISSIRQIQPRSIATKTGRATYAYHHPPNPRPPPSDAAQEYSSPWTSGRATTLHAATIPSTRIQGPEEFRRRRITPSDRANAVLWAGPTTPDATNCDAIRLNVR